MRHRVGHKCFNLMNYILLPFAPNSVRFNVRPKMKKWIMGFMVLGLVLLPVGLFVAAIAHDGAVLKVRNDSPEPMSGVVVELVGYGSRELGTIQPGQSAEARFRNYGDSSWIINVQSHSGGHLWEQAGYLTNGMNYDDEFAVGPSGSTSYSSTDWILVPPIRTILGL